MNKKLIPITCPCSKKNSLERLNGVYICKNVKCEHNIKYNGFKIYKSKPILISQTKTDTIFSKNSVKSKVKRTFAKHNKIKEILIGESLITKTNCDNFIKKLLKKNKNPKVLIIGGAQKGSGTKNLYNNKDIEIHSIDIYYSDNVDVICDCHYLSLMNDYYDGVWIQAVLEHVVEPSIVIKEIYRVLKLNGVVYAETPFMQQVHEGAYDFNRFTVLGHRYLFRNFKLVDMGGNEGPEVVLSWSIRYLTWSIFRSEKLSKLIGILLRLILRPLKFIINEESLYDASSGVFFMGTKVKNFHLKHKNLVKLYRGQFR